MPKCKILAVVIDDRTFATNKVKTGDWVTLTYCNQWKMSDDTYATDHRGTWGGLGVNYRPIINLETGELYDQHSTHLKQHSDTGGQGDAGEAGT